ncbi:hydroxymethylglutaryl-CoA synthase [Pluteus cervinus]|uniref:Hydroxymethylglutaryl-CoA synthase n=1 Tax=Pluteus cervinus TaxID=181527 RepID=A0ACD3ADS5_9AGAR|nr:hydroxymethylglutaryl-CoA synthase [Pluteus cervinus]
MLRDKIFNTDNIPAPDFTLDDDPVTASNQTGLYRTPRQIPRPADVGIIGLEVYLPKRCISIEALENLNGVAKGQYAVGLGQEYLAFPDDREDINSFALTTVSFLLKKYKIGPEQVGRIDIGTEATIDKSVKGVLMDLFAASGNHDIEGNACDGSTAALFNAVNWIESSSWDGRYAIVFAGDIAIPAKGAARPVGGAGAVAMLIGPNAPLIIERARGSYMANTHDFYKPQLNSEYPEADEVGSVATYLTALDESYKAYQRRYSANLLADAQAEFDANLRDDKGDFRAPLPAVGPGDFDFAVFQSPYGKLVQKAHARLMYHDFIAKPDVPMFRDVPQSFLAISLGASREDESVEKTFTQLAASKYDALVQPSLLLSNQCGNMGTGSLYGGLASLLTSVPSYEIFDKRIALFAYGSGCASSFFAIRVKGDTSRIASALDLKSRLSSTMVRPCSEYVDALQLREENHNPAGYEPAGSVNDLWPGTYYLKGVDSRNRRSYGVFDGKPVPRVLRAVHTVPPPKPEEIKTKPTTMSTFQPNFYAIEISAFAQIFSVFHYIRHVLALSP